jgi:hypothetical protein
MVSLFIFSAPLLVIRRSPLRKAGHDCGGRSINS